MRKVLFYIMLALIPVVIFGLLLLFRQALTAIPSTALLLSSAGALHRRSI